MIQNEPGKTSSEPLKSNRELTSTMSSQLKSMKETKARQSTRHHTRNLVESEIVTAPSNAEGEIASMFRELKAKMEDESAV